MFCYVQHPSGTMHDDRSRQLPTNQDHAARHRSLTGAIREYQLDRPSIIASLPGPGLPRDGPSRPYYRTPGLDGLVYISKMPLECG